LRHILRHVTPVSVSLAVPHRPKPLPPPFGTVLLRPSVFGGPSLNPRFRNIMNVCAEALVRRSFINLGKPCDKNWPNLMILRTIAAVM